MNLLSYQSFYLVGIKGVAMTALAQCLLDAGKKVTGSDVAEDFVTQPLLDKLGVKINVGFDERLPKHVDCVIFTAAHGAQRNPQVLQAVEREIPTLPHAQALAELFNAKKGIAVCGVGGKSTTSAMIAWILDHAAQAELNAGVSFAIGVGNIPGLDKTGQWQAKSEYFVAEADEYVIDPAAVKNAQSITPRFSFLKPYITVCTNLHFDHPDVYRDFEHTKQEYGKFFSGIKENGSLIINGDNDDLVELAEQVIEDALDSNSTDRQLFQFGKSAAADFKLTDFQSAAGWTEAKLFHKLYEEEFVLKLQIPGEFNVLNAMAAILAAEEAGVPIEESIEYLASFRSTLRRAEYIGEKRGVKFYDDYAHHPDEIAKVIHAFREWFPDQRLVVAFQSHTFSRTKALFNDFVDAFQEVDEVTMINIFASAREQSDDSVSSDLLCEEIHDKYPNITAHNLGSIHALAGYLHDDLHKGNVCLTIGAGDIYQVHDLLK